MKVEINAMFDMILAIHRILDVDPFDLKQSDSIM